MDVDILYAVSFMCTQSICCPNILYVFCVSLSLSLSLSRARARMCMMHRIYILMLVVLLSQLPPLDLFSSHCPIFQLKCLCTTLSLLEVPSNQWLLHQYHPCGWELGGTITPRMYHQLQRTCILCVCIHTA